MAQKKAQEFKTANETDIRKELSDKREALRAFRFGVSGSKVKNVKEGMKLKKEIARIMTELSLREKTARANQ